MLTALASATFTLITLELLADARKQKETAADPIRVIEAVTAGVAFLAAGAIIQSRGAVKGLTTGAGMWLAGAVGVATGAGYYVIAVFASVLALVILTVVYRLTPGGEDGGGDAERQAGQSNSAAVRPTGRGEVRGATGDESKWRNALSGKINP